jgi:membrane protein implicated in regulation of membrane protease activity
MSFLASLLAWANVPFTIVLAITICFALMQMTGLLGLLAGGGDDADADGDADGGDADGDADADGGDADGDGDADHDGHDHDSDDDGDGDAREGFLGGLGVGRVPLTIVWQTFAATFAFTGLAIHTLVLAKHGSLPVITLAFSVPASLGVAYVLTRAVTRPLGRLLVDPKQQATSRKELVGQTGVVISTRVSDEFGEVKIADKTGHVVRVICQVKPGESSIPEGAEVVVVDFDEDRGRILVAPM